MTADQLKTDIQFEKIPRWVATSRSSRAKFDAKVACADFEMCLIACTVGGEQTSLKVGEVVLVIGHSS